ncbi:MAG: hypothetical protein CMB70_00685 [Euryarchaeota archaeon]|nr:hypothetical protein [Euryarchaeota archaeon]|tara:strand:+ start:20184 stop:21935 length:1752 start_codon:yes stop_codon:yes gene_type:complete
MSNRSNLLSELYQARLEDLKEIASAYGLAKNGSVEYLRAQLIRDLILPEWDLTLDGLKNILNNDLGRLLGVFGIKKTGSLRTRRQRLYLHLNHDPKQLKEENLDKMTKEELHALCKALELPRSGNRQTLLIRVAGVLSAQHKNWGTIKRSLKRGGGSVEIPYPGEDDEETVTTTPSIEEKVDAFVNEHPEGWSFEDESNLIESIEEETDTSLSDVAASIEESLTSHIVETEQTVPPMMQELSTEEPTLEEEAALLEINSRRAEVEAAARDYLLVGSTTDADDMNTFIASLSNHGFSVELVRVQDAIRTVIMETAYRSEQEQHALSSKPGSWSEREAIRLFEQMRPQLRERIPEIVAGRRGNLVQARMEFEEEARTLGLDLRSPAVSGRLHALFDLHLEISEAEELQDPSAARRNRMLRILYHGAVHLPDDVRRTIERLERNLPSFESLVETVLESSEGDFSEAQQSLIVRFLESKGYLVNTAELRPRVLACAGIVGTELGYLTPSQIPRLAPGILVSDDQVDAIVAELKALAATFKPQTTEEEEPELELAESVADASDRVGDVRGKIDRVDALLSRLRLQDDQ